MKEEPTRASNAVEGLAVGGTQTSDLWEGLAHEKVLNAAIHANASSQDDCDSDEGAAAMA